MVARGIRYAADNGAKIINMSLGAPVRQLRGRADQPDCAPVIEAAIRYAVGKGVLRGDRRRATSSRTAIRIRECHRRDRVARARAPCRWRPSTAAKDHAYYSSTGSYVELAAPGGSERGFGNDGVVCQQTFDFDLSSTRSCCRPSQFTAPRFDVVGVHRLSSARRWPTPHVAGVAAMLMQQGITDPAAIEAALEKIRRRSRRRRPRRHVRLRTDRCARDAARTGARASEGATS